MAMNGVPRGSLIRPEARIPKSLLSSTNRYSKNTKMLTPGEIRHWNSGHESLLDAFGLKILGIEEVELSPEISTPMGIELLLSQSTTLSAAMPALAVALKGRGDLLAVPEAQRKTLKKGFKEVADLRASASELEVFYSIVSKNPKIAFLVRVGEGAGDAGRRKPGEGLNASLFPGQLIVNNQHAGKSVEQLEKEGVKVYRIATDPVEGTTKTVMGEDSALTSVLIIDGEIAQVPDLYMEKLTVDPVAASVGMDTNETLAKNVQALSDAHKVLPGKINNFLLDRTRHPIERLLDLGVNLVRDSDGDLLPGIAPAGKPGVYENGLPLHTMLGDTGGAAEYIIAALVNQWLGGSSHGKFVSAQGMKKAGWAGREDYTDEDVSIVEGAGFKLGKNYPINELVSCKSGIAAFGGITDNAHFPQLRGVHIGANYAQVDVLQVGASGRFTHRRITFGFKHQSPQMIELFSPVSEVLMNCDVEDIRGELRLILGDSRKADRLQREIGLSLYQVFEIEQGKFKVNDKALTELGDVRTNTIVTNLMKLKPDWFV